MSFQKGRRDLRSWIPCLVLGVVLVRPASTTASTKEMVALLERMAREADPRTNLYLNEERADLTARELEGVTDPATRARGLYLLAPELLLSGDTEAALEALEELDAILARSSGAEALELRRDIEELEGVAYLRLAEQQNCLEHGDQDACLLPFRDGGVHRNESGSRLAIEQFAAILEKRPDNVTARWLLNFAYMTLGEYPGGVPVRWRIDPALFASDEELPRFRDRAPALGLDVVGLAGGVVIEDLDGDGDLDLVCSSWGMRDPLRIFRNDDGVFVDQTDTAGLDGIGGGLNLIHADYDNDGLDDILVLRGAWWAEAGRHPNSLLKNTSDDETLSFEDVTHEAGVLSFHPTQTAAWADYDNDGWLDLFIGNESEPSELFHSDGDGTFTEVSSASGITVSDHVKAVSFGDYDNDGDADLYVSALGAPNRLYRNDDGERFRDVADEAGVAAPIASFPAWFFDFDNDGWLDIFVSGYRVAGGKFGIDYMELAHEGESPRLYRNRADGRFEDITNAVGLDRLSLTMGSNFGDLDGDGYLDFYLGTGDPDFRAIVPNRMYRNVNGERVADVTTSGGFGHVQKGHAVAFADLDHDGDEDVYAVMGGAYSGDVYRNVWFENPGHGNRYIVLKLEGARSNRSAIGARVEVRVESPEGARQIHHTIGTGGSFGSTSLRKTIGLGDAVAIRSLEIFWPGSQRTQRFNDVPLDRFFEIREGSMELTSRPLSKLPFSPLANDVRKDH